jgi:predicted DNA-binding transcriptional regulator AlpA
MSLELALKEVVAATLREQLEPLLTSLLSKLSGPSKAEHQDDLVTTEQLSKMTSTAPITWVMARHEGRGPKYLKIGRSVRYRRSDIETFLRENGGAVGRRGRPPIREVQTTGTVTGRGRKAPTKTVEVVA